MSASLFLRVAGTHTNARTVLCSLTCQKLIQVIIRYKVTKGLLDQFGEKRVIDSPITESGFCGLTVGAALAGLHPVVSLQIEPTPCRTL